jgi:hypothetical protein
MGHQGGTTAIVGAGPYGLSIAAHFQAAGIEFRIFGSPMYRWMAQMPKDMFLKSEGCGSNLSDPTGYHCLDGSAATNGCHTARGVPQCRGRSLSDTHYPLNGTSCATSKT